MLQEKSKKIISWTLTIICMGVIFWLSSRTSDESSAQSDEILQWLINIFGDNFFTTFIVRKLAHCLEFTGLSLLFNIALKNTLNRKAPLLSVIFTSLYAVTDEIHQIFVPGRSCEFRDWVIDTSGAVLGTVGFLTLMFIIEGVNKARKRKKH